MPRTFNVSVAPEARAIRPDAEGRATAAYTVTNNAASPARGRVRPVPRDSLPEDCFEVEGAAERDFRPGETHQFTVRLVLPPGTPDGTYGFRLDVVNVADPQEDFTEGDGVAVTWKAPRADTDRRFSWWPIAAAVTLIVIAGLAFLLLRDTRVPVPRVADERLEFAIAELLKAELEVSRDFEIEYVPDAESDTVVGTRPAEGEKVEPGSLVSLIIRRRGVKVPPLVSADPAAADAMTIERASADLLRLGLDVATVYIDRGDGANVPAGVILDQEPDAGTVVGPATVVRLTAQQPPEPVRIPEGLIGKPYAEVRGQLDALKLGYAARPTIRLDIDGEPGTVRDVQPPPNTLVEPGTKIVLTVKGVEVPQFKGKTLLQYVALLGSAGLTTKMRISDKTQDYKAVGTNPKPGEAALPGEAISIQLFWWQNIDLERLARPYVPSEFERDRRPLIPR